MSLNQSSEFTILGSNVRIKSDEKNYNNAINAINILQKEVEQIKAKNSQLKDIDIAVLCALKFITAEQELDAEYKESMISLKQGVEEALNFIEKVSPGTMQV